jgi:hypothetical protein
MQSGKTQREDSECLCPVSNIFMVLVSRRLRRARYSYVVHSEEIRNVIKLSWRSEEITGLGGRVLRLKKEE